MPVPRPPNADVERFRTLVELSPEALYVLRDARFVYVNPAAVRLFGGTTAEDLLGTRVLDRVDPAFHALANERRDLVLQGGAVPLVEMTFLRLDGTPVEVEVQARAIPFDGRPAIHVAVRDITGRKAQEAALRESDRRLRQSQKLEAVGRLAGGVAHEFNNALAVILGHAELALGKVPPGDDLREELLAIEAATRESIRLTAQLLAFARKQPALPRRLDPNRAVEASLRVLRRLLGEDVRLDWRPADGVWPIHIDPTQLDQICASLCVNARDATDGKGTIVVTTANVTVAPGAEEAGDYVRLSVSDDGPGLAPDTLEKLFEPFFTTKPAAAGVGLAAVYGIVRQNGGFVRASSAAGQGATVEVHLPRHEGPAATAGSETILVVDDEPLLLRMTQRALAGRGYRAIAAAGPEEALALVDGGLTPDLVLTDVVMPRMSGPELVRRIAAAGRRVPAVYMSGYAAPLLDEEGQMDPDVSLLAKPFTLQELAETVRTALDRAVG